MSRSKTVTINSIILSIQQVVVNLISIFVIGYTARKLGQEDYGIFSLAFTFPVIFSALSNMGFRTLTVREIARQRNIPDAYTEYMSRIIPPRLFFILCVSVLIILIAILMGYEKKIIFVISIATFSYVFELISRIALDVFQAYEKMGKIAFRDIVVRLVSGIFSVVVLYLGYGLYAVSFVYLGGNLVGFVINFLLYKKHFKLLPPRWDFTFVKKNLKESFPFMLMGFTSVLYTKIDIVMLSKMVGVESVGAYNAAANLFYRLNFVGDAIATASFSAIAQLYWSDHNEALNVFRNSIKQVMIISVPMAVGGFVLAEAIILFIFGREYQSSTSVFKILAISIPLMFIGTSFSFTLGAIREQKFVLYVVSLLSIFNFMANLFLIPQFVEIGAAVSTLVTQFIGFCLMGYKILKHFKLGIELKLILQLILATLIMVLAIQHTYFLGLISCIVISGFFYAGSLMITGGTEIRSKVFTFLKRQ
ncbi:MAG: flippase [Desulfobacteraceae bacterium]|nr:MAG: flippase [Desulfobacteraceae bacterium]